MLDADLTTTTPHKSSCASADPTLLGYDAAISNLYGMTRKLTCELRMHKRVLRCALAQIICPLSVGGLLLNNVPLERGHVKCFVTKVFEAFKELPLVPPDQQQTLGESLLYHIQWPRNEITVLEEIPPTPASSTIDAVLQADLLPTPQQIIRPSVDDLINSS